MELERFEQFTYLIAGIYRNMQRLKTREMINLGLKNVHIFWIYLLSKYSDGLTASELARRSHVDRGLISREIDYLIEKKLVCAASDGAKRRYGGKLCLTAEGREKAAYIGRVALYVQEHADQDISERELIIFYQVLTRLYENFAQLSKQEIANE